LCVHSRGGRRRRVKYSDGPLPDDDHVDVTITSRHSAKYKLCTPECDPSSNALDIEDYWLPQYRLVPGAPRHPSQDSTVRRRRSAAPTRSIRLLRAHSWICLILLEDSVVTCRLSGSWFMMPSRRSILDSQLLQRTRSMLKARVDTARTCPERMFGNACAHFLSWLTAHPLLRVQLQILDDVARRKEFPNLLASRNTLTNLPERRSPIPTLTSEEHAALAVAALRQLSGKNLLEYDAQFRAVSQALSGHPRTNGTLRQVVDDLRQTMLDGLATFLDEAIDGQFAVVSLLKKYKQRSEWYRRARLRSIAGTRFEGQRAGEDSLMVDLYEYVHDQGIDFRIESWSASGRADLVADSAEGQRLVLDGKYVRQHHGPAAITRLIAQGLRQVRDYCQDHNEAIGYLVTYVNKDVDVQIEGAQKVFPAVGIGGVTVVCIFINIFEYPQTASERPKSTALVIPRADLLNAAEEANVAAEMPEDE
jgi:hypothetical protein